MTGPRYKRLPAFEDELAGLSSPVMGVYAIQNRLTGRAYIGASTNVAQRWRYLISTRSGAMIHDEIRYYGLDAFKFEVLETVADVQNLSDRECEWIRSYPRHLIYNPRPHQRYSVWPRALEVSMDDIDLPTPSPHTDGQPED